MRIDIRITTVYSIFYVSSVKYILPLYYNIETWNKNINVLFSHISVSSINKSQYRMYFHQKFHFKMYYVTLISKSYSNFKNFVNTQCIPYIVYRQIRNYFKWGMNLITILNKSLWLVLLYNINNYPPGIYT